ncbi:MAG: efflux RND transporter permease subunit [Candidatus Brocadiae bacterium]|nr:efflux RND transporter permease subunit [Candidatus Brocadiia bacterium]
MKDFPVARFSVSRPVTVTMLLIAIVAVGALAFRRLPVQLLPSGYTPPFLFVRIPFRDGTPREVERFVTRPAEDALATVRNVQTMNSRSGANEARVWLGFRNGTDMDAAYAEVRDRMDRAMAEFPEDVERYSVFKFDPTSEPVMEVSISYPEDIASLTALERALTRAIERLPGVAKLEFEGLVDESIRIEIDRDKARAHGVNLYQLVQRLRSDDFTLGSGSVIEGGIRHSLRSVAVLDGAADVAALPVRPGVTLGDVADVRMALSYRDVISRVDGKPAITLEVFKESEANTVATCLAVRKAIEQDLPGDPELAGVTFHILHDSGRTISDSISTLGTSAWQGALASLAILWIFLLRMRMSLLINLSVPVSLCITLAVLLFTGETLNIVTLMGLTLSIGMLVDNSVVVSENIDRLRSLGTPPVQAAVEGTGQVALAVILSTCTSIVVFLPIALMSGDGMMAFFLGRLAIPVCVSMAASLVVSLALIPAATVFLSGRRAPSPLAPIRWAAAAAGAVTGWCLRHRLETLLVGAAFLGSVWFPFSRIERSLEPSQPKSDLEIFFRFTTTGNMAESSRNMRAIEAAVDLHRAELQTERVRTRFRESFGRMTLYLDKRERTDEDHAKLMTRLKAILPVLPGVEPATSWRGGEGRGGQVDVQLTGDDTERLAEISEEVKRRLLALPGVADVTTDLETGTDEIRVRVKRERAARAGIDTWMASGTVSTALRGSRLPDLRVGDREIPLILQFPDEDRENLEQLAGLSLWPPGSAAPVPLGAIADFEFAKGLSGINHENRRTSLGVKVMATGQDTFALSQAVKAELDRFAFPQGLGYDMGSWSRRWAQEEGDYGFAILFSVVFVFLLMGVLFESWALPLSVLVSIPLALVGAFWFLWVTKTTFDILAGIGMVILVGVVVNNAIVLIDRVQQLREEGMERTAACIEATRSRFRPIWITALTTICGLIPMAIGDTNVGGVPYAPLARTVLSGLFVSTALTLLLVPVLYSLIDDARRGAAVLAAGLRGKGRGTAAGDAGPR